MKAFLLGAVCGALFYGVSASAGSLSSNMQIGVGSSASRNGAWSSALGLDLQFLWEKRWGFWSDYKMHSPLSDNREHSVDLGFAWISAWSEKDYIGVAPALSLVDGEFFPALMAKISWTFVEWNLLSSLSLGFQSEIIETFYSQQLDYSFQVERSFESFAGLKLQQRLFFSRESGAKIYTDNGVFVISGARF